MLNLSDKELDRLSREAAEKFEVEQDPTAWQRLEQLLDKELGRSSPVPKFSRPGLPFIYTPAVILLISATYFIIKSSNHKINATQSNSTAQAKKVPIIPPDEKTVAIGKKSLDPNPARQVPDAVKGKAEQDLQINEEKSIPGNPAPATALPETKTENKKEISRAQSLTNPGINPEAFSEKKIQETKLSAGNVQGKRHQVYPGNHLSSVGAISDTRENGPVEKTTKDNRVGSESGNAAVSKDRPASASNPTGKERLDKNQAMETTDLKKATIGGLLPVSFNGEPSINDSILLNRKMPETGLIGLGKGKNGRTYYTNRSLQIGLLFSPDFSEVRYNYENKVGANFGFSLAYQLNSKLAINSGLVFTSKNYTANGYDFHAPPGYWTNRVALEFVKANCNLLELPLNLRYDFNKAGNTTFFINGGLSSYLLKKENYTFFYHDFNFGFLREQNDVYSTGHNYWFSVLNLSTGFETRFSNSFSLQVEPYMKLPLTGIGLGKVDLTSYGVDLAIKFSPLLKKKRR